MGDEASGDVPPPPKDGGGGFGFKKRSQKGNVRKREVDDDQEAGGAGTGAGPSGTAVVRPNKAKKEGVLDAKTAGASANPHQREARFTYTSERKVQEATDGGATRMLETETAKDRDARALREQVLAQQGEGFEYDPTVYKGLNNYRDYKAGFRREHTISSEKGGGAHGPLRANTTVRGTFIMDYKPDICKDYKETGYCGYGDSCKFMHDRGDYKSGWELDREWEEKEKERKRQLALKALVEDEDEESDEDDGLPFACFICRENFATIKDPVMTKCKHYFCEHCALKHFQKSKLCFVCDEPTGGVFNIAKDIIKKTKERAAKEQAKAEGVDPDAEKKAAKAWQREEEEEGNMGWAFPSGGNTNYL